MLNKFLYSVSFLLVVFALFGCTKQPLTKYTIKFEAIGKDAIVTSVNMNYYTSKGDEITEFIANVHKPKFEKEIKTLKGKTLSAGGRANLPEGSSNFGEDVKIKVSILKGGKVVKEETTEGKYVVNSKELEVNA